MTEVTFIVDGVILYGGQNLYKLLGHIEALIVQGDAKMDVRMTELKDILTSLTNNLSDITGDVQRLKDKVDAGQLVTSEELDAVLEQARSVGQQAQAINDSVPLPVPPPA